MARSTPQEAIFDFFPSRYPPPHSRTTPRSLFYLPVHLSISLQHLLGPLSSTSGRRINAHLVPLTLFSSCYSPQGAGEPYFFVPPSLFLRGASEQPSRGGIRLPHSMRRRARFLAGCDNGPHMVLLQGLTQNSGGGACLRPPPHHLWLCCHSLQLTP